jgi:hypothetical protein
MALGMLHSTGSVDLRSPSSSAVPAAVPLQEVQTHAPLWAQAASRAGAGARCMPNHCPCRLHAVHVFAHMSRGTFLHPAIPHDMRAHRSSIQLAMFVTGIIYKSHH